MARDLVVLVDEHDNPLGNMEKIEAHEKAVLHRAFSVFVFNDDEELLLQQRAKHKYHSPGLWANTCCSHQQPGENSVEAGEIRLEEEMGFTCQLKELFTFIYKAPFDNGLTEHELDHVLIGRYNDYPNINPDEVADYKWMKLDAVKQDIDKNPNHYTAWFKIIFEKFYERLK